MKLEVIKSDVRHISPIAKNMREADKMEIAATGTPDPYQALWMGHRQSEPTAYTVMADGKPISMFGVGPIEGSPKLGTIWLLGTDDITNKCPFHFLRTSKRFLPTLLEPYHMVCNIVDSRNTVHIRWMKWLGFKFIRPIMFGPENRLFWEFAEVNNV